MTSIARPSRRVRASATAMRYWGLRILRSRVSLILTAMVKRSLLMIATLQFRDLGRDARIRLCLTGGTDAGPYPCGRQPTIVPEQRVLVEIRDSRPLAALYNFW